VRHARVGNLKAERPRVRSNALKRRVLKGAWPMTEFRDGGRIDRGWIEPGEEGEFRERRENGNLSYSILVSLPMTVNAAARSPMENERIRRDDQRTIARFVKYS
jgi:hypothetical protein